MNMTSILTSIKKLLGIPEEYTHFDQDIIIHINSVFSVLNQLGYGPENGFRIEDDAVEWNEYLQDDNNANMIKDYVYLKVKLLFDPPVSSALIEAINRQVNELEWRINNAYDTSGMNNESEE